MTKNRVSKFAAVLAGCVMTLAMAAPAMAQEGTFVVDKTVELPGISLAAGTYVFKQGDSNGLVQISDDNGHNVGIFLTYQGYDKSNITALTLNKNRIESVHFAENDVDFKFIYPKKNAEENKVVARSNGL